MAGRRGNGEGTIYKRSDGTWCGMLTNGLDPKTGKPKRLTFYGKTREAVADKILDVQSDKKKGVYVEPTKVKVGEWLDTWLQDYMKLSLRPTTYSSYEHIIRMHIKPSIGERLLRDLRPEHLQRLYNTKFSSGRLDGNGGLSPRSVRYIHIILHEALDQAVKNQLVVRNVSEATTLPKQAKKEIRVFTLDEQLRFTEVAENDRLGAAFKLDLASGLRLGELLALKWQDIDLNEGVVKVRNSLARVRMTGSNDEKSSKLIFQEPKTKSGKRNVPIPGNILQELKEHKTLQDKEKCFMGEAYVDSNLVFCTQYGTPIEPRNMMRKFYELVNDAGIAKANFHTLRHTFATRALEAGIQAKVVQEMLGHANISMTLDIYSHVMPELKKSAADKLNHLFDKDMYGLYHNSDNEAQVKNSFKSDRKQNTGRNLHGPSLEI